MKIYEQLIGWFDSLLAIIAIGFVWNLTIQPIFNIEYSIVYGWIIWLIVLSFRIIKGNYYKGE